MIATNERFPEFARSCVHFDLKPGPMAQPNEGTCFFHGKDKPGSCMEVHCQRTDGMKCQCDLRVMFRCAEQIAERKNGRLKELAEKVMTRIKQEDVYY